MFRHRLLSFLDVFHPVLLKELRQEMRTRGFVQSLLVFHGLIGIFVANELISYSGSAPGRNSNGWFWTIIGLGFLVFTPIRGFSAFRKEEKANELEMIFLTNISPWEMVVYKCAALWLQGLLIMLSAVPYGVLRYFTSGMDLAAAGYLFCFMLYVFVQAVAVSVSMSASRVVSGRAKLPFIAFWFLFFVGLLIPRTPLYGRISSYAFAPAAHSSVELWAYLFFGLAGLSTSIVLGASKIAERGEDYSFGKRLLLFVSCAGLIGFSYLKLDPEIVVWGGIYLLVPLCASCLFEEGKPDLSGVSRSIGRRPWAGGLRRLFYRGWAGGTAAVLLSWVLVLCAAAMLFPAPSSGPAVVWPELALAGLLFAAALFGRSGTISLYLLGSAACVLAVLAAPRHLPMLHVFIAGVLLPLGFIRFFWRESRRILLVYCLFQAALIFISAVTLSAMVSRAVYQAGARTPGMERQEVLMHILPHAAAVKALGGAPAAVFKEYNAIGAVQAALALLLLWLAARPEVSVSLRTEELARVKLRQLPEGVKPWK